MIGTRRLRRLLLLLPSGLFGGTERHSALLARRLRALAKLEVDLATEPALLEFIAERGLPGIGLHPAAIAWQAEGDAESRAARQAAETRRLLAALQPDAALVALPWPDAGNGLLPVLAEAALPRLVLLHLAREAAPPETPPALGLDGAVVAAVSAPVARRAALAWGLPEAAVAVLPNPAPTPLALDRAAVRVELRAALGLAPGARLLLFVGRLEEAKGADLLPGIIGRLDATLLVAGDGKLRGMLQEIAAADPYGRLRLLGPVADPAPWYLAADALLLPSRLEGAPLAFLEAAANRCPVVASAAAVEAFGSDAPRFAAIAQPADAAGMAAAAAALLADPDLAWRKAAAAARLVEGRDWSGLAAQTLGLLRAAVAAARGGTA